MFLWLHDRQEDVVSSWKNFCKFLKRVNWGFAALLAYIAVATALGTYFIFTKIF